MNLKIDPDWLLRMAELENGCCVSVGGWVMRASMTESQYGKSVGYNQAYAEGCACKYEEWTNRGNPYPEGSPEREGYYDGYSEAVSFA